MNKKDLIEEGVLGRIDSDPNERSRGGLFGGLQPGSFIPGGTLNRPNIAPPITNIQNNLGKSLWEKSNINQNGSGISLRCCDSLRGPQEHIVRDLQHGDVIVLAKPAVGKTMPIICYWANHLLELNSSLSVLNRPNRNILDDLLFHPENLPQVLWLAPIQSLTDNQENDIKKDFADIVLQSLNRLMHEYTHLGNNPYGTANNALRNSSTHLSQRFLNFIRQSSTQQQRHNIEFTIQAKEDLITQFYSINDDNKRNEISKKIEKLDVQIFDLLQPIIKNHVENKLIGKKYMNYSSNMIQGETNRSKPFVISIYESANSIIGSMDRLRLIVCDEFQRMLPSGADDVMHDERAKQIMTKIDSVFSHRNVNRPDVRMALLSGTTHVDSARNMARFLNVAYDRTFPVTGPIEVAGSNEGDIHVLALDGLDNFNKQVNIIKKHLGKSTQFGGGGIVFIILSKKRIEELIDACTEGQNFGGYPQKSLNIGGRKHQFDSGDSKKILGPKLASQIKNESLRRAVAAGIGRIYRLDDAAPIEEKHDNQIVQELFLRREIKVLLSTEAIREGLNIKAKKMYIPTIENVATKKKMTMENLCQLINRVGREPGIFTIYTASKFVIDVEQAVEADPSKYAVTDVDTSVKAKSRFVIKGTAHRISEFGRFMRNLID